MISSLKQLEAFFDPRSVAIVGATKKINKAGHVIFENFVENAKRGVFKGKIFPVNPYEDSILGFQCYASVDKIPVEVELVVIVVPANVVTNVMEDAATKRVKAVVIISSGFGEIGNHELEDRIVAIAKKA